jgi:putative sporulation protein YyaC
MDYNRLPYFLCIGSNKHSLDGFAPMVGTILKKKGFNVMGTMKDPLNSTSLPEKYEKIKAIDTSKYQIIAVDLCLDKSDNSLEIHKKSLKPGKALDKDMPYVGEISIVCNLGSIFDPDYTKEDIDTLSYLELIKPSEKAVEFIKTCVLVTVNAVCNYLDCEDKEEYRKRRALSEAMYIAYEGRTTRELCNLSGIKKSQVQKDIQVYVKEFYPDLYVLCLERYKEHNNNRSKRGAEIVKKIWENKIYMRKGDKICQTQQSKTSNL